MDVPISVVMAAREAMKDPLLPHVVFDIGGQARAKGLRHHAVDGDGAALHGRVARPNGQALHGVQVHDLLGGAQRGRDLGQAAEHRAPAQLAVQHGQVLHAVQQRDDDRVRPHSRADVGHARRQIVGLAAEDDHVDRTRDGSGLHRLRRRNRGVTHLAMDHQPARRQLRRPRRAHQKRHVLPVLRQPTPKIPADRTGTHHQKLHRCVPVVLHGRWLHSARPRLQHTGQLLGGLLAATT
nr:hypothetical protein [Ottowia sp. GY511]